MSATVYGISSGGFTPNNDFSATQSDKGGWTATQTFQYIRGSLSDSVFRNTFSKGRRATEIDTNLDVYWSKLFLDKVDIATGAGGIDTIKVSYAGYAFSRDPNGAITEAITPVTSLKGTVRERPITEHPTIVALSDGDKILIQGILDGRYVWNSAGSVLSKVIPEIDNPEDYPSLATQPTAGNAALWCKKVSQGDLTFESSSFTYEVAWESEQPITTAIKNKLGKIAVPDPAPANVPATRDFRLIDLSEDKSGELYRNRLEYLMSEAGGWDTDKYDY